MPRVLKVRVQMPNGRYRTLYSVLLGDRVMYLMVRRMQGDVFVTLVNAAEAQENERTMVLRALETIMSLAEGETHG